ncbi:cytochrome b5, partial [Armillaria luteobubalina]
MVDFSTFPNFPAYALLLAVPVAFLGHRFLFPASPPAAASSPPPSVEEEPVKTIMQPPKDDLPPPKDDPYSQEELRQYDGSDPSKPIYVSIKGTIFDVTRKADVYGPGKSYSVFAGKDGSRGLGMSSLKVEDAVPDYSVLDEKDTKVLDDWHAFFLKRYPIVGRVKDHPIAKI